MQLAPQEQQKLLKEVLILEQHLQGPSNWTHKRRDQNTDKFVIRKKSHDAKSTKYLDEEAWGLNNAYLCKMRKRVRYTERTAFGSLVAPAVAEWWHDDDNDESNLSFKLIDSYQRADATYTAKYLYGVNACRGVFYKDKMSVEERVYSLKEKFDQYNKRGAYL